MYNDSHSTLLEKLGIEDTTENAMRLFVRAELTPADGDRATDLKTWKYILDQDVIPTWYEEDPCRYEQEFRTAVEAWVAKNTVNMVNRSWTALKSYEKDGHTETVYLLNGTNGRGRFGDTNNYSVSDLRKNINESKLLTDLKAEFGDRLVPVTIDLTSLDGLRDYGVVEGDLLVPYTLDLHRECRENIPNVDIACWTPTPNSTPSGYGSSSVRCVSSGGYVCAAAVVFGAAGAFVRSQIEDERE